MSKRHIVAAVEGELGYLPGTAIGIGGIRSACGIASVLARHEPDEVVLVGTVGAYPRDAGTEIDRCEVCVATRAGWASGAAVLGRGYVPRPPEPLIADPDLVAALTARGARPASVVTVPAITTDPELVAALGEDWDLEHLETYSVAHACAVAGVRFVAVLGVANVVGPDAHAEYVAHHEAAQRAVQAMVAALPRTARATDGN